MQHTVEAQRRRARAATAPREIPRRRLRPLTTLPFLLAVMMLPQSYDGAHDVKLLCAAAVVAMTAWWAAREDWWARARPLGAPGAAAAILLAAVLVSTATSDQPLLSWFGPEQFHNGAIVYVVSMALALLVAALMPPRELGACARALAIGGAVAVGYWLVQLAGLDPLGTMPPKGMYAIARPLVSTLDNPNFAGAFLAAGLPAGLWAAWRARTPVRRWAWAAVTALLALGTVGAASLQAPIAAAAGLGMLTVAALARRSRRAATAALLAGALLVLLAGAGLAQRGPLAVIGRQETAISRTWDWTAAARMTRAEPLTGVGFSRYGRYHPAHRPPHDVRTYGWQTNTASAHNVPLDMASGGGLPLLAAYLAFVALVGLRLLRGLRTLTGAPLELLGVFGAVWTAYQAQSLVSIDVPQLALLHYLSAGAILALTAAERHPAGAGAPRPWAAALRHPMARQVAVAALALIVMLPLLTVVTAEKLVGASAAASSAHDKDTALARVRLAARLAPWEPLYWAGIGVTEVWGGEPTPAALEAYLEAVRRDPRGLPHVIAAADAATALGRLPLAMELLDDALVLEPHAAEVKVKAATVALRLGQTARARALVRQALAFAPDNKEARALAERIARRPEGGSDG